MEDRASYQHGYHHRCHFGEATPVDFVGFEDSEARFKVDSLAVEKRS